METDINRLKVVLAEKKRTNKWLSILPQFQSGVRIAHSLTLKPWLKYHIC